MFSSNNNDHDDDDNADDHIKIHNEVTLFNVIPSSSTFKYCLFRALGATIASIYSKIMNEMDNNIKCHYYLQMIAR